MFPLAKKVGFKAPLTEEIKTTKFTLRHSDIESSSSTISTLDLNETKDDVEQKKVVVETKETEVASPHTGDKRESSDEEEDEDGDSYPTTPVAGRRKRHRQWRWTLGPAESASSPSDAAQTSVKETIPVEEKRESS